ncbi:MAG: hypothetical protein E6R13_00345, partial [Spirochaetes bacterium]
MSNGKTIRDAMKAAKQTPAKPDPFKHDVIEDPMGQWKYPGQITKIPSGNITMQGVPYPVYGKDDLGNGQMMYPGMDYQFPGQYVTEYPQIAKYGGGLLNKTLTCPKCGWSWKAADGGKDIATCHKCGGTAKLAYGGDPSLPNIEGHYPFGGIHSKTHTHMSEGGWLDQYQTKGEVKSYKPKTIEEYNFRNKMYNDSLALANQSRKIDWIFPKNPNISKEEYYKLKELEDSYPQYAFLTEQYDIDKKKKTVGEFKDYIQQYYLTNSVDEKKSI